MPDELANRRFQRLENQFTKLQDDLSDLDSGLSREDRAVFLEPVLDLLQDARKRKQLVEGASADTPPDLYDRYVAVLDDIDMRLDMLHEIIGYIELHARQRADEPETIEDIRAVCDEICNAFNISVTILPTIWHSYAMFPLHSDQGTVYSLFLPRHTNPRQYQPLISHELGHALFDTTGRSQQFRDRVWEIDNAWGGDSGDFAHYWNEWYPEFFCDACGVLTFGPAYVYSLSDYLHNQRPYDIAEDHPPTALRLHFIKQVAQDTIPTPPIAELQPLFEAIESHLQNQEPENLDKYNSYVNDELLQLIQQAAQAEVETNIENLLQVAESDRPLEDVDPAIRYRVKVNREWS